METLNEFIEKAKGIYEPRRPGESSNDFASFSESGQLVIINLARLQVEIKILQELEKLNNTSNK